MISQSGLVTFFGLFVFGFAVVWTVATSIVGWFFALFGIPFLLAGAWLILAPLRMAIWACRTRYAVTDRRVILIEPSGLGREVWTYAPVTLTDMVRTQRWEGSGDLIFEEIHARDRDGDSRTTRHGFRNIPDVRRVENLIRSTLLGERV